MGGRPMLLYVGGFRLPDKNAAAQRVLANAKLFNDVGYRVVFLNYSEDVSSASWGLCEGFEVFNVPLSQWTRAFWSIADIQHLIDEIGETPVGIIAYNHPSLALSKLIRYCKSREIKCIGDITEWYSTRGMSWIKKIPKYLDTKFRMDVLNRSCDGLIVISKFLESYYRNVGCLLYLPPLIDRSHRKWAIGVKSKSDSLVKVVYAGTPSRTKERLDVIARAVQKCSTSTPARLDVIGITKKQFEGIYGLPADDFTAVSFRGRLSHSEVLEYVSCATWSVLIRDDNLVTRAGFPTKFVESLACGTPVVCNDNSDLRFYVEKYKTGILVEDANSVDSIAEALTRTPPKVTAEAFDYRRYKNDAERFFANCLNDERERHD